MRLEHGIKNPLLNSILYDVSFPDGQIKQYSANIIAENMYQQVDNDGYTKSLLKSIVNFEKDQSAVSKEDKYITTKSGQQHLHKTTVGWKLWVQFKDGSEFWVKRDQLH